MSEVAEKTRGRWRSILPAMGVEDRFLTGRHTGCPMCGGRDRFRFDDKEGRGTFFCTNCGAGDGFRLVELISGRAFKDIVRDVERAAGVADYVAPKPGADPEETLARMRRMWRDAVPASETDWWSSRSLPMPDSPDIKYNPSMRAVLSLLRNTDGKVVNMHRTYLNPKRRLFMPLGIPAGSAVRACNYDTGPIGIAEGIETALAASAIHSIPVWACATADNLSKWTPPDDATEIIVFGDNDASFAGMAAAGALAKRLVAAKKSVSVLFPPRVGQDWNDVLVGDSE